jgi:16S rRNA G966 N2-methylase RsmD
MRLFLADTGLPWLPRGRRSLEKLMREAGLEGIIVWGEDGPTLHYGDKTVFFHPSMAKNRRQLLKKQEEDVFSRACRPQAGDAFLDCTMGLGADAIIAAYHTQTEVVALESEPLLAAVIKWGMQTYDCGKNPWLRPLLDLIRVVAAEHGAYLAAQPDRSYDIVYFDPMFRQPLHQSQPIAALRSLANPAPLTAEAIREACRVARKRVVMKETVQSREFERLGFPHMIQGRHSPIGYGVIEI